MNLETSRFEQQDSVSSAQKNMTSFDTGGRGPGATTRRSPSRHPPADSSPSNPPLPENKYPEEEPHNGAEHICKPDELYPSSILTEMSKHQKRAPYTPIEPGHVIPPRKDGPHTKGLLDAVDDFYKGLDDAISAAKNKKDNYVMLEAESKLGPVFDVEAIEYSDTNDDKSCAGAGKYDEEGWEINYLDSWRSGKLPGYISFQGNIMESRYHDSDF